MNTAEAILKITDRGRFELLTASILRKTNREYNAIIHTGMNASGETIKSPVDGFCLVPGSLPEHFVLIQYTTMELKSLKNKWLKKPKKKTDAEGDLIKSGRIAKGLRGSYPDAKFTVVLATNQRLDLSFITEVYAESKKLNLSCEIIEQSRIVDFLDTTPDGHWLRKEYLGIDAELMSEPLFLKLCNENLQMYEAALFADVDSFISRKENTRVYSEIQNQQCSFEFLIANSGYGKSVVAYQTLKRHLKSGGCGLWIPAELFSDAISLEDAAGQMLRKIYPSLDCSRENFIKNSIPKNSRLLIVVDDVNRTEAPTSIIKKILTFSTPKKSEKSAPGSFLPDFFTICPAWPQNILAISNELKNKSWVSTNYIQQLSPVEGKNIILQAALRAGITITDPEALSLSEVIGNDPILIGLFCEQLVKGVKEEELPLMAEDVIARFIDAKLQEIIDKSTTPRVIPDFKKTLRLVARCILMKGKLYPYWSELESWLGSDSVSLGIIRELTRDGKLCRLSEDEKLIFRHDRVLEYFLTDVVTEIIREDLTKNWSIIEDPFYADIIGKVVARENLPLKSLEDIGEHSILSLVHSVQYLSPSQSAYRQLIAQVIVAWINNAEAKNELLGVIREQILRSLMGIDSPAVIDITDALKSKNSFTLLLARFRNGDTLSGVIYCGTFTPSVSDSLRNLAIAKAKKNHHTKILRELKQILVSPKTNKLKKGALALAGFLGFPELKDDICVCWSQLEHKESSLGNAIWAAVNCCGGEPGACLNQMLECWANLPEGQIPDVVTKEDIAEELQFALASRLPNVVVAYLLSQVGKYASLKWVIIVILSKVDDPDAAEFIVRTAAEKQESLRGTDCFSPWLSMLTHEWDGRLGRDRRLSSITLDRVRKIWESAVNSEALRNQAFRYWLTGATVLDLDLLRKIKNDSVLFRSALWKRVSLGDYTALSDLIDVLKTETGWFTIAHKVWDEKLIPIVTSYLQAFSKSIPKDYSGGQLNAHYDLSKFMMMIPALDAEEILVKHWDSVGAGRLFIQAALYIGTPKCLALAASSIKECPKEIPVFEHVAMHFGIIETGRDEYITTRHLLNLVPYFDRIDEHNLGQLAEAWQRLKKYDSASKFFEGRFGDQMRKLYSPTEEDLRGELDSYIPDQHSAWRVEHWIERFNRRGDSKSKIIAVLDSWLVKHCDMAGLKIAAEALSLVGNRNDLSMLEKHAIVGPVDAIVRVKNNLRFSVYSRTLD